MELSHRGWRRVASFRPYISKQVGDTGPVESARRSNSRALGSPFSGLTGQVQTMMHWRIEVPCVNDDADQIRRVKHELSDFFLVRAASLFTLQRFGAQINWRIISRKIFLNRIAYCQSNLLSILLERAETEIRFEWLLSNSGTTIFLVTNYHLLIDLDIKTEKQAKFLREHTVSCSVQIYI